MSSHNDIYGNTGLLFGKGPKKNKTKEGDIEFEPPTVNTIIPLHFSTTSDHQEHKPPRNSKSDMFWLVRRYPSSILPSNHHGVKEECNWGNVKFLIPDAVEWVTYWNSKFIYVYMHPFSLRRFTLEAVEWIDPIIIDFSTDIRFSCNK